MKMFDTHDDYFNWMAAFYRKDDKLPDLDDLFCSGLDVEIKRDERTHAEWAYDDLIRLTRELWEAHDAVTRDWLHVLSAFKSVECKLSRYMADGEVLSDIADPLPFIDHDQRHAFSLAPSQHVNFTKYLDWDIYSHLRDTLSLHDSLSKQNP